MKLNKVFRYSALAAAVIASSVQAADPGVTKTVPAFGSSSAVYAGGATINNGASFLSTLPAGQPIDLVSQVTIAPGDVGETGDLLVVVQVPGQPDVYDDAYGELDFTYTRYLNDNWTVSLKAKNLLNQMRETTQGGLDVNSLFEGRNASLGVEYVF